MERDERDEKGWRQGTRERRECEDRAEEYLGAGFRQGRLWLGVAVPSEPGWEGGARWFRCDVMEVESVYGDPVQREGSLAGKLADDPALRLGCYTVEVADGAVERMSPVGCDQPHQAEFVGAWPAPGGSCAAAVSRICSALRLRPSARVSTPLNFSTNQLMLKVPPPMKVSKT